MRQDLVSVVITTYNRVDLLCHATDSVVEQTYKNIEIIVVDDCSNDGTEDKIGRYLGLIKYVRNDSNLGPSGARNVGIRTSSGDYISFLDDDDLILPDKIENQVNLFNKNTDLDVVYCGWLKKSCSGELIKTPKLKGYIYPEVLACSPGAIHTMLVRRKCFDDIGCFDLKMLNLEDHDMWIRLAKKFKFGFVDEPLVVYNIHGCQVSLEIEKRILGMENIISKYCIDYENNSYYLYEYLRRLASRYALLGSYDKFYHYIFKAISLKPLIAGGYIHLVLSFVSRKLHKFLIAKYGLSRVGDQIVY